MKKKFSELGNQNKNIILIGCVLVFIGIISSIVYFTGGTAYTFTHLMYAPIILAAFLFGIKGAIGAAFIGGVALGPWMPANVSDGTMQEPRGWMIREMIFLLIGLVVGYLFQYIKKDRENQIKKSLINTITGYSNASKLKMDLDKMINKRKSFSMIAFRLMNLDNINRYVDYNIGEKSILKAIEMLANLVGRDNIYSVFTNEFVFTMWGNSVEDAYLKAKEFLRYFHEPILVEGVPITLTIQCSIINYPLHAKDANDLYKRMGRTFGQQERDENRIAIYDNSAVKKNKAKYDTVVLLYDAIKEGQFTMVYQPIINLSQQNVKSVEALLRWNNSKNLNTEEFIQIAEDAGIISEITKWVITNAINQIRQWQDEGIRIKVAINLSSKDLKDDAIVQFIIDYIKVSQIDPTLFEIELTERVIVENVNEVGHLLNRFKEIGVQVSLDDFGTGYNSFVQLANLPIDFLKIDKFFIDHIEDTNYRFLVEGMINLAHDLGKKVIAEGVETKEQLEILKGMDCDNIQGYYFSKPISSDELKKFELQFNKSLK